MNDSQNPSAVCDEAGPIGRPAARSSPAYLSPRQKAWRRLRRHRPAMICGIFLMALLVIVLLWPWVSPYQSNELSDAQFQPPGGRHWCGTDVHGRDLLTRMFYGARISLLVG